MKTPRNHPIRLLAFTLGLICVPSLTHAATWYWIGPGDNSPTSTAYWNSTPTSGTGQTMSAAGAAFSDEDIYDTNKGNKMLISGNFTKGILLLNGSTIGLRSNNATRTISNLEVAAAPGAILSFDGYNQAPPTSGNGAKFIITNLSLLGDLRLHNPGASGNRSGARNMTYEIANVTGEGLFRLTGAQDSTIFLSIADQDLTNSFSVETVNVLFRSDITTSGTLTLNTGASVNLNGQSVTFSSITDGTHFLASGTYSSADDLVGTGFEGFFSGLSENSTITISAVPEPAAFAVALGGLVLAGAACLRRRRR